MFAFRSHKANSLAACTVSGAHKQQVVFCAGETQLLNIRFTLWWERFSMAPWQISSGRGFNHCSLLSQEKANTKNKMNHEAKASLRVAATNKKNSDEYKSLLFYFSTWISENLSSLKWQRTGFHLDLNPLRFQLMREKQMSLWQFKAPTINSRFSAPEWNPVLIIIISLSVSLSLIWINKLNDPQMMQAFTPN